MDLRELIARAVHKSLNGPDAMWDCLRLPEMNWFRGHADAALAAIEASGTHVVVPVEPTQEQEHAGWDRVNRDLEEGHSQALRDLYRAMLAARPRHE